MNSTARATAVALTVAALLSSAGAAAASEAAAGGGGGSSPARTTATDTSSADTAASSAEGEPAAVPYVDVRRYLGTWFQIAAVPREFDAKCAGNVHGTYGLGPSGSLTVRNGCTTWWGEESGIRGAAKPLDASGARLNVSFVPAGDGFRHGDDANYIVVGLDRDYRWAVVTDGRRRSGFVLSRSVRLDGGAERAAKDAVIGAGLDPCAFRVTRQDGGARDTGAFC